LQLLRVEAKRSLKKELVPVVLLRYGAMAPETSVLSSTFQCPLGGRVCNTIQVLKGRCQWIGLRENLQETMVFTIKYRVFL